MNGEFIFETLTAYQRSEALKTALELDLFTALAVAPQTAAELAEKCNAAERGMRILCDYLAVIGLLQKQGPQYSLTAESNMFLNKHSSAYFGSSKEYWQSPLLKQAFDGLLQAVRKGGTALPEEGSVKPDHEVWVNFARSMMPMMAYPAQAIAKILNAPAGTKWKVLDIAAGHGLFGIAIARQNPNAEIVAVDWPAVLQVASENAVQQGISERYRTIAGNAFDCDLGNGYDVVLLTNFLHHFDIPTGTAFLKKIHAGMNAGGRAVILDFVTDDDRISPRSAAASALLMLATTPSGDAYTYSEYTKMLQDAGFSSNQLHQIPPAVQQVIIAAK